MADIYSTDLPGKATEIRNESDAGENTATRVGDMFLSIIDYISQNEEDWLRDTGGTGQDQLLPVGLTGLLGSLSTVNDLPSGQNKILVWKNADANPNGWGYLTTPTGGTGTGNGDVTWSQLTTTALQGHQIDGSHLADALSNYLTNAKLTNTGVGASKYTWWGRYLTPSTSGGVTDYKVEGPLSGGITYIQFSNGVKIEAIAGTETTSPALRVVDANTTAGTADFYAMGGVSALGNSSSGGGGGDTPAAPIELGAILNHVKGNTASTNPVPNPIPEGATIRWDGNDWVVDKTTWGDLGAVAPGFTANNINYLLKCSTSNGGYSYSYEWIPISSGSGNVALLSNVGDVAAYNPSADGILTYVNGASAQEKWQYKRFLINPSQDVTYDGTPASLTSIILGGTKYNVPTYTIAGLMGNSTVGSSTQPIYWDGSDFQAINYEINKTVPANAVFTDHIYTNGNGLDLTTAGVFSVKAASGGGLAVDSTGIKINPNTNKRVLWGNQDTLVDDIGKSGDNKSLGYVQDISMYGSIVMNTKNSQIQMADPTGATRNVFNLTNNNQEDPYYGGGTYKAFLDVGYASAMSSTAGNKSALRLWGEDIMFKSNGLNNSNTMILTKEGSTYLPLATQVSSGLRIGDAVLYWDSQNNSLAVKKYDDSACNFYAFGGVSALGMSSGIGTIPTMTFGSLTVNNDIAVGGSIAFGTAIIYEDTSEIQIEDTSVNISGYLKVLTGEDNTTGGIWFGNYHLWVNAQGKLMFEGTVLN